MTYQCGGCHKHCSPHCDQGPGPALLRAAGRRGDEARELIVCADVGERVRLRQGGQEEEKEEEEEEEAGPGGWRVGQTVEARAPNSGACADYELCQVRALQVNCFN